MIFEIALIDGIFGTWKCILVFGNNYLKTCGAGRSFATYPQAGRHTAAPGSYLHPLIKVFALTIILFAKVGFSFCKGRVELCFDLGPTLDFANEVARARSSISPTHPICRVTNRHTQDS